MTLWNQIKSEIALKIIVIKNMEKLGCKKVDQENLSYKEEEKDKSIKGIHLYFPQYCERNSCHNVKIFLLSSGFSGPDCDS